jgi:hypothetical protein
MPSFGEHEIVRARTSTYINVDVAICIVFGPGFDLIGSMTARRKPAVSELINEIKSSFMGIFIYGKR